MWRGCFTLVERRRTVESILEVSKVHERKTIHN
jgi:hypothetical protein